MYAKKIKKLLFKIGIEFNNCDEIIVSIPFI